MMKKTITLKVAKANNNLEQFIKLHEKDTHDGDEEVMEKTIKTMVSSQKSKSTQETSPQDSHEN